MNELTHLSLFSGIGGLDLAAEWAGFRTVGQCEWADYPRSVLEKHWPGLPRWRDIRTLTGDDFFAKTGLRTVTVLSGGFPCQPFSTAGKRRGKEDDRYLWPEMLRVISEIRPSWVVGENVAGIVSMALDTALSDLESIGYACQAFVIPACAVDAPHRRDRVAIVAHCGSIGLQAERAEHQATGVAGICEVLSHTNSERLQGCKQHGTPDQGWKTEPHGSACECGSDVSNADGTMRTVTVYTRRRLPGFGYICETDSDSYDRSRNVRWERQLSTAERNGRFWSDNFGGTPEYGGGEWWPAEPDVGRSTDGIPCWLDGIGGLSDAAKTRAGEILRDLREETFSEAVQWTSGRFFGISESEILLAYLCEYEENCYGSGESMESGTVTERQLRDLWRTIEIARASHRRKYHSQLAGEYSNALLRLSHGAPSLMPQAWANGTWESGIARIASGVPFRVDRLKCLGNAVVPQQFYPIFRAIAELEGIQ